MIKKFLPSTVYLKQDNANPYLTSSDPFLQLKFKKESPSLQLNDQLLNRPEVSIITLASIAVNAVEIVFQQLDTKKLENVFLTPQT